MTLRSLHVESEERLRIKFSFTPSGGSLVNCALADLQLISDPPFVTHTSCEGKPDHSGRWQSRSGRMGCQQTEEGRKLSPWSYARLLYRHLRLEFPVLALLSNFIQERFRVREGWGINFISKDDIKTLSRLGYPTTSVSKKLHRETHLPGQRRL